MNEYSDSYMEMALHADGKEPLILRIPTFWDAVEQKWIGIIQTPKTKKLIHATGDDSFSLENNFNIEMSKYMHDDKYADEVFEMFKPKAEWKD